VKILILDDMDLRHNYFAKLFDGNDITHAFSFSQFLKSLNAKSPFDLVCLDHDLGEFEDCDHWTDGKGNKREFNGQHAAIKIIDLPDELLPKQVLIHSMNPSGAKFIYDIIKSRGIPVVIRSFANITSSF